MTAGPGAPHSGSPISARNRGRWVPTQACRKLTKVGQSRTRASEKVFELTVTSLDLPPVGVIDLVADFEGRRTVVDFKTAASAHEEHEALPSDQLTAYQLAEPEAEQAAFRVLIKTAEPKIDWHLT